MYICIYVCMYVCRSFLLRVESSAQTGGIRDRSVKRQSPLLKASAVRSSFLKRNRRSPRSICPPCSRTGQQCRLTSLNSSERGLFRSARHAQVGPRIQLKWSAPCSVPKRLHVSSVNLRHLFSQPPPCTSLEGSTVSLTLP